MEPVIFDWNNDLEYLLDSYHDCAILNTTRFDETSRGDMEKLGKHRRLWTLVEVITDQSFAEFTMKDYFDVL